MSKLLPLSLKNLVEDINELDRRLGDVESFDQRAAMAQAKQSAAEKACLAAEGELSRIRGEADKVSQKLKADSVALLEKTTNEVSKIRAAAEKETSVKLEDNLKKLAAQELAIVEQGNKAKQLYDYCVDMDKAKVEKEAELKLLEDKLATAREAIAKLLG